MSLFHWKLIDCLVNAGLYILLYTLFDWRAFIIGIMLTLWNFADGQIRTRKTYIGNKER